MTVCSINVLSLLKFLPSLGTISAYIILDNYIVCSIYLLLRRTLFIFSFCVVIFWFCMCPRSVSCARGLH